MEKNYLRGTIICTLFLLATLAVGGVIGFAVAKLSGRTGGESSAAIDINREIVNELRRELERNQLAVATVENLRRIHSEADSAIGELRLANRRSSDILTQIREEINLLEDYLRRSGGELDNFYSGADSELE